MTIDDRPRAWARSRGRACVWMLSCMLLACVQSSCGTPPENPYPYAVSLRVVDEAAEPIAGASVEVEGRVYHTDARGEVLLERLFGPIVAIVEHDGHISDFVAFDPDDRVDADGPTVELRLFAAVGPDGARRWTMHAAGDVMLGRRYLAPPEGLPLLGAHDIAGGSRAIVEAIAPTFGLADLSVLNLETVVGDFTDDQIYPAKRFILLTPPEALAALTELSVDIVTLGNNHTRDYFDVGVDATFDALDAIGMPFVGGTDSRGRNVELTVIEPIPDFEVAMFSFTTVDGDFVNDSYAPADEPRPAACDGATPPDNCFMYDLRSWGCDGEGVTIPSESRRIGQAWRAYADLEDSMSPADQTTCWDSLYAVYPEMQDWVARRGHGGATPWDEPRTLAKITAAAAEHDLVVVQLHAGFQFQTAPSNGVQDITRKCVDAGADIVIAHHPHVLQGVEWYQGKLILHSLANFIFDQDFFVTFRSAFVRTVWEESTMLEARLIPTEVVRYHPKLVTGASASHTIDTLWESSATPAYTARDVDDDVRRYLASEPPPDGVVTAHMRTFQHSAVIERSAPPIEDVTVELAAGSSIAAIDYAGLIHAQAGGADVEIGRELFGWGHLEDALADGVVETATHWFMPSGGRYDPVLRLDTNAATGFGWLEMYREAGFSGETFARPLARVPLPEFRLYRADQDGHSLPDEGEASYTMRLHGKLSGAGQPYIRLEFFWFDDTDPTEDPTTIPIGPPADLPIELAADGEWHTAEVDIDGSLLWVDGVPGFTGPLRANVVLVRLRLGPPSEGETILGVDDFEFIEWRPATQMQDHFGSYQYLRSAGGPATFTLQGMPSSAP